MALVHSTIVKHGDRGSCGYWRWIQELDDAPRVAYGSLASTPGPDFYYAYLNFHSHLLTEIHATNSFDEAIEMVNQHAAAYVQKQEETLHGKPTAAH